MLDCAPGDLDPHAVASVLKAYLRERACFSVSLHAVSLTEISLWTVPEPILTHALNPYFEAAMLTETKIGKSFEVKEAPVRKLGRKGPSLPSGLRDRGPLRKAPSLSTLALPNFSGMRPSSQDLLNTFASPGTPPTREQGSSPYSHRRNQLCGAAERNPHATEQLDSRVVPHAERETTDISGSM
jgi:hypothetical protein